MKVLLVATVQSHICQFHRPLAKMLHENGCEVHVAAKNNLAEKNGLKLDFAEKVYDVPFARSPKSPDNLKAYQQLKKIIDSEQYDVIHCNTPMGGIVTRLAARKARKQGTKVIYTAHGFHFFQGGPKKSWLVFYPIEKFMAHFCDKLITINEEDYALAKAKFPTNVEHIHGIGANTGKYHMISEEERRTYRRELGIADDQKIVICTGELNANKNQKTAIAAMQSVVKDHPEAVLLLAGNGAAHDELEKQIRDLGLEKNVHLLGYRTDLERYVQIADLIVSCSKREGLPVNIIEGMLCRKPVVASINRGHKELVKDGENGYLLENSDAEGFAQRMTELLSDAEKANRFAEAGYQLAQLYADTAVYNELYRVYKDYLSL